MARCPVSLYAAYFAGEHPRVLRRLAGSGRWIARLLSLPEPRGPSAPRTRAPCQQRTAAATAFRLVCICWAYELIRTGGHAQHTAAVNIVCSVLFMCVCIMYV